MSFSPTVLPQTSVDGYEGREGVGWGTGVERPSETDSVYGLWVKDGDDVTGGKSGDTPRVTSDILELYGKVTVKFSESCVIVIISVDDGPNH